jgi:hypothetical protein
MGLDKGAGPHRRLCRHVCIMTLDGNHGPGDMMRMRTRVLVRRMGLGVCRRNDHGRDDARRNQRQSQQ